jgi:single-stranded DNA-specific DHH superfamily exonuclease
MIYDIFSSTAPAMPKPAKGTECIRLLLSQVTKGIQKPMIPMSFPSFGAHISCAEFQYPDNSWKDLTGIMGNLVAKSGDNKG